MKTPVAGYEPSIGSDVLPTRYSKPALVARGGMGDVYRATDSVLERTVAVKLLADRYARDDEARARFEREALAAARLSGTRHVVTIFDVGEHRGRPLIVMEYLEGGTVHDRLARGHVPRQQALEWLRQTAEALDRAHEQGVVHRDVKPANLLLDHEGAVHVSDFGIASASGVDTLTLPGTVLGTAAYLSPEQARGEAATPASDRYAFGVLAFELLTGRRPFEAETATTEAFAHLHAPVPSAATLRPELPDDVDAVFERALAKTASERPASCTALVTELERALTEREAPMLVIPAPVRRSETPTRRLPSPVPRARGRSRAAAAWPALVMRARSRAVAVWSAVGVAVLAVGIALVAGGAGDGEPENGATRTPTASEGERIEVDGAALNARGFRFLQAGEYERALPVLRRAVLALRGSGLRDEAWASYNLALARFQLERCDGVIGLLERSEQIQGQRSEIDELRAAWAARCAPADDDREAEVDDDEDRGQGKGKGRDKGKGSRG